MKFLSNTHNPKDKFAMTYISRYSDETPQQAWENYLRWLDGKIIGRPQATEAYTVEQLESIGMVGVYAQ
jgi:hypothetical protein